MLGFQVFTHAANMVFRNLNDALRVSLGPWMIIALVWFIAGVQGIDLVNPDAMDVPSAAAVISVIVAVLVSVFMTLTVAVAWHRYVLLEEIPQGWFPQIRTGLVLGYFGRSFLIGLVVAIAAGIVGGLLMAALGAIGGPALAFVAAIAIAVGAGLIFYRLSLILPAGAIGNAMRMGESWRATAGLSGAIITVLVISVIISVVGGLIEAVFSFVSIVVLLVGLAIQWLIADDRISCGM